MTELESRLTASPGSGAAEPLGPDSLTWKYFGQWRGLLLYLWAGAMQNMHPGLGAAVEEYSDFFTERWQRLYRSQYPIFGVVYDGPRARETARTVRGYHDLIKGVNSKGRRYHALDPDTFYWAHATFFMGTVLGTQWLKAGLSDEEKRRLFDEHVQWYRLYGMSMRPVPGSWEEFERYWEHMCADVLEDNKATRDVLAVETLPKPHVLPWLPDALWRLLRIPIARGYLWVTVGMFPPQVRRRLGYRWTRRDERVHRSLGRIAYRLSELVPFEWRYHPRARAGWRRAAGKTGVDAPLIETPRRNLPPPDQRGKPWHYSPDIQSR